MSLQPKHKDNTAFGHFEDSEIDCHVKPKCEPLRVNKCEVTICSRPAEQQVSAPTVGYTTKQRLFTDSCSYCDKPIGKLQRNTPWSVKLLDRP